MTIARFEHVATFDDEGRVEGLQFDSRERRMQLWREKKEAEEFDALIAKLRQHKNYRSWYDKRKNCPEFRAKMQAHNKRMRQKHGAARNAAARAERKQEAEKSPIVNVCQECKSEFTIEFGFKRKRTSKFCSRSCRNRFHHRTRSKRK